MGSIKVTKIEISGQGLLELGTVNFDHFTMTDKAFQGVDSVFLQQLQAAWQDWISKARMPQEVIYA